MEFSISPIGVIQTPFDNLEGMPIQPSGAKEIAGTIILEPEYEEGLDDIDGFSHLILLYMFHKSRGFNLKVKPFLDNQQRGLFSTRAPRRPNAIGLSIVQLIKREGCRLSVKGVDVLNNTPLIDIKPYVPKFDVKKDTRCGWLEKTQQNAETMKSDNRFVDSSIPGTENR